MNKAFFRALLGASLVILLSSCYDSGMYYPAGGYPAGVYGGYDNYYEPVGYGRFGGVGPYGYRGWGGGRYYNNGYRCSRCHRNPCSCSGGHHHHQSSHSRSSSNSGDRKYRIIAGDLGGKTRPNDFHSLDWYHNRGYSLQNVKVETDRGTVIDRRPSSQRSSSSNNSRRSSSSSSSGSKSRSSSSSGGGQQLSKYNDLRSHVIKEYQKKK